jgi:hypothetical protein
MTEKIYTSHGFPTLHDIRIELQKKLSDAIWENQPELAERLKDRIKTVEWRMEYGETYDPPF